MIKSIYSGKSVAFIGSVGVPNCYGGFESFVEAVAPEICKRGGNVSVTCDSNRYEDLTPEYKGMKREFLSIPANGWQSPIHDIFAFFKVLKKHDAIIVLGVSAGPLFLLMRIITTLFGKTLVINIDGIEWRRTKFSKKVRLVLRFFDFCAQLSANKIIYDNEGLYSYVLKPFRSKAVCIAYSGDHVKRFPDENKGNFALTVCRIEPENNIEMLIEAAKKSNVERYVVIGNWDNSEFGKRIKRENNNPKISLLDPIYDAEIIGKYRESCAMYLHGHSVGGTNPSLVEMLYYDCALICFDCVFNRATAENDSTYFASIDELVDRINAKVKTPSWGPKEIRFEYTAEKIASQYMQACE
jgi:glycosyltransferase involved in cell wall biosynthesis